MFFQPPPPPPVSYSRQVAPILALHCNGCHGDAGGLSTRTHAELMSGGNMGKVVVPGDGERSLLVHFIDGRRGEQHRMPLGGRPLSGEQIATIRRWIAEGAQADADTTKKYAVTLAKVRVQRAQPLRIFCRVHTQSYLTLAVRDPRTGRGLHEEVASIQSPHQRGDSGAPGELIWWDLRAGRDWPRKVTIELTIAYAAEEPLGTELYVRAR